MRSRVARRLLLASFVIIVLVVVCWQVLPRLGVSIPWWVPVIGFVVIALSALLAPGLSESDDEDDPDGPIPFRKIEDEGEGVSAADRERFG